jgi:hypothetical protein
MQSGLEEHAPVIVTDVSTFAGSDNIGIEWHHPLIRALLRLAKLLKGSMAVVLSRRHPTIMEVRHSCLGMIALWVPRTALVPCGSDGADKMLFCKYHSVPLSRVNNCVELEHVLNCADKNHKVLLLVATIVERQNGGALIRSSTRVGSLGAGGSARAFSNSLHWWVFFPSCRARRHLISRCFSRWAFSRRR